MTQALEIKQLTKIYSDGFQALKGVDLSVEQGDFFALLGPNGAGKSTMIGIITSLLRKTSGSVAVFGHDIDKKPQDAQSCIGFVPQEFNFNVFERVENIIFNQAGFYGLDRKTVKPQVEFYLKKLDLWDKRHSQALSLSGGMKRRLMIARAMIHNPQLLILDEPTAGVDLEIRLAMWEFIKEINQEQGTTIILTTHYLEEAEQMCKNIAIINQGNIVEQTSMKKLLSQLNTETVVLDISHTTSELSIDNFSARIIDNTTLEVEIAGNQSLNDLFIELEQKQIIVHSIRNKSNRLETLFLNMVQHGNSINE